jgi:hypothetical protein
MRQNISGIRNVEWPLNLLSCYSECLQHHQNAFLSDVSLSMETGKNCTEKDLVSKKDVQAWKFVCSPKTLEQTVPCVQAPCRLAESMTLRQNVCAVFA